MRPQDIERIANSVMGAFTGPSQASAGCGSFSSTQEFTCSTGYFCQLAQGYNCGGQALFECLTEGFGCIENFECPTSFSCPSNYTET